MQARASISPCVFAGYWKGSLPGGISLPLQVEAGFDALQHPWRCCWAGRTVHNAKRIQSLQWRYFRFLQCRWTCDSSWRKEPIHLSMAPHTVTILTCICFVFSLSFLKSKFGVSTPVMFFYENERSISLEKQILKVPTTSLLVVSHINENMKTKLRYDGKKRKRQNLLWGCLMCKRLRWLLSNSFCVRAEYQTSHSRSERRYKKKIQKQKKKKKLELLCGLAFKIALKKVGNWNVLRLYCNKLANKWGLMWICASWKSANIPFKKTGDRC